MEARARILAIRLMEAIQKHPEYARSLGIEVGETTDWNTP